MDALYGANLTGEVCDWHFTAQNGKMVSKRITAALEGNTVYVHNNLNKFFTETYQFL